MHDEILTREQKELTPLLQFFAPQFGLVGGTAIALHLGHRRSIDFDLFTNKPFRNGDIRRKLVRARRIPRVLRDERGQYTVVVNGVFVTFFHYDYPLRYRARWGRKLRLPDLITLAAMKAHALGRRAKWKDYVDLYFILRTQHTMEQIVSKAKSMFKSEFNERFFRQQLAYFQDIDYTETVEYLPGFETDDKVIQRALIKHAVR